MKLCSVDQANKQQQQLQKNRPDRETKPRKNENAHFLASVHARSLVAI